MTVSGWGAGLARFGLVAGVGVAIGQTHKVARPEQVVRAVGVYEWTGDLDKPKGERLVPVTIFVDGQMQDAGVYLARPVPLALNAGTVYELDEAGVEKGLVDLKEARHVQIPAAADLQPYDDGWFGYGSFAAPARPKALPVKKPTAQVAVNGKAADGEHPTFGSKGGPGATAGTASGGAAAGEAAPVAGSPEDVKVDLGSGGDRDKDEATVDVDRPTLRRRSAMDPKEAKKARKERDQSSVTGEKGSLNDDPDRPTMKRGKGEAAEEFPALNGLPGDMRQMVAVSDAKRREPHPFARAWEDEAEHQAVLGKMRAMARAQLVAYGPPPAGGMMAGSGGSVAGTSSGAGAGQVAGGSGASGTGSGAGGAGSAGSGVARPAGSAGQDTSSGTPPVLRHNRVASGAAASEQVTSGTAGTSATGSSGGTTGSAAKGAVGTSAAGASAKGSTTGSAAKGTGKVGESTGAGSTVAARRVRSSLRHGTGPDSPPTEVLVDEEVRGFTLSYGGAPTYIYTAHTAGSGAALRYVTIVAQADGVNNELRMAMHGVTDAAHLDRQAWMRFVDAVDVEASNRASLMFELRGQTSRQFALYRVIGGKADTMFLGGTTQ